MLCVQPIVQCSIYAVVQLGFSQGNFLAFESEPTVSLILVKFGESQVDIEIEVTTEDETAMGKEESILPLRRIYWIVY